MTFSWLIFFSHGVCNAFQTQTANSTNSTASGGTAAASESDRESGDSEKESMSDKDSDSTGTSQSKKALNGEAGTANNNETTENKDKEVVRKRGRRAKDASDNINA